MPVTASTRPPAAVRRRCRPAGNDRRRRRSLERSSRSTSVAERGASGVAGRGGDDGARRRGADRQRAWWQRAGVHGEGQLGEVGVEQWQERLRLGIAEAAVVLDAAAGRRR